MYKIPQQSSPVTNVVQGQNAIHRLAAGPRYHQIRYIITALYTAATAGFVSASLGQVIGIVQTKVNTKTVREILATELDKIQTDWSPNLAVKAIDGIANDLQTAVADVVAGGNTARTTTFIFTTHFAEPTRDSYKARQAFALPTSWSNGKTVSVEQWLNVLATAGITNVVIRAEEVIDTVLGSYAGRLANGQQDPASAIVLPMTHFFRSPEIYTSTKLQIRDWPFTGVLQQMSVFSAANGDNVAHALLKADGVVKWDQDAATIDSMNRDYGWNYLAFTAPVKHLAMDFDDDPTSSFPFNAYRTVELTLTLAQATANSSLVIISQVWRDALAS
jgi:hypothetical protein